MTLPAHKFLLYWFPILVYAGLILLVSSFSRIPFKLGLPLVDKLLHFVEYALLAVLVARAVRSLRRPGSPLAVWLVSIAVVVAFGALDEIYQSSVPGRRSEMYDLLADGLGGLAGSLAYLVCTRRVGRRESVV